MREIKFRGWDGETMFYHDDTMLHGNVTLQFNDISGWGFFNEYSKLWQCGASHDSRDVLMQYTGVKDIDNEEIYEGDLCRIHVGHPDYIAKLWLVSFKRGAFGVQIPGSDSIGDFTSFANYADKLFDNGYENDVSKYIDIVGNIYENPELLDSDTE